MKQLNEQLFDAINENNINKTNELINEGADIDAKNDAGFTPLMVASKNGYVEVAKLLIFNSADIEAETNDRMRALLIAGEHGQIEILKLLLKNDVNINAEDKNGNNTKSIALLNKHPEFAEIFKKLKLKRRILYLFLIISWFIVPGISLFLIYKRSKRKQVNKALSFIIYFKAVRQIFISGLLLYLLFFVA